MGLPRIFLKIDVSDPETEQLNTMNADYCRFVHEGEYEQLQNFRVGWMHTVFSYQPPQSTNVILKADVKLSIHLNGEPHHPWVALNRDGTVITAHCDCNAGLGESCSHVGTLLQRFPLVMPKLLVPVPCEWNKHFLMKVEPNSIANISFYKDSSIQ